MQLSSRWWSSGHSSTKSFSHASPIRPRKAYTVSSILKSPSLSFLVHCLEPNTSVLLQLAWTSLTISLFPPRSCRTTQSCEYQLISPGVFPGHANISSSATQPRRSGYGRKKARNCTLTITRWSVSELSARSGTTKHQQARWKSTRLQTSSYRHIRSRVP